MGPGKTTSFTVGGSDQEVDGPSGSVHVNPVWNGAELDMQPSNGTSMKRYLEGDLMVLEVSHTGTDEKEIPARRVAIRKWSIRSCEGEKQAWWQQR